jgi:hypothetical protein
MFMLLKELESLCQEWQQRLRLADWDVKVALRPARDMQTANHMGQVSWDRNERVADIACVQPGEEPRGLMRPYDVEQTLVHELLHLHFCLFERTQPESSEHLDMEFAINAIASALVSLKRAREITPDGSTQ